MKKSFLVVAAVVMMAFAVNTHAQKSAVGIQGALALPMGDFGDVQGMGFGGVGTFLYNLNPQVQLTGAVGYISFSGKDITSFGVTVKGATTSMIPIVVGGRYLIGQGTTKPYAVAELGIFMTSSDVPSQTVSYGGYSTTVGGGSVSSSNFGFGIGGGVLIPAGSKLNIDINAKFNAVSDANFIGVNAGVQFAL